LTEQFVANALAAQGIPGKPKHYVSECPRCRQSNKVSLKRVRLPEPEETEESALEGESSEEQVDN
jgi:hypothetical protein